MKRVFALFVVLLICVLSVSSAAAMTAGSNAGVSITASDAAKVQDNGIVEDDDMVIDLNLVTTLVIVICSILAVGVIIMVVYLGRKNRS